MRIASILIGFLAMMMGGCSLPRAAVLHGMAGDRNLMPPGASRVSLETVPIVTGGGSAPWSQVRFTTDMTEQELLQWFRQELPRRGWRLDGDWEKDSGDVWLNRRARMGLWQADDEGRNGVGLTLELSISREAREGAMTRVVWIRIEQKDQWTKAGDWLMFFAMGSTFEESWRLVNVVWALPMVLVVGAVW